MLGERGWGPGGGEGMPSNSDHETKISLGYAQMTLDSRSIRYLGIGHSCMIAV